MIRVRRVRSRLALVRLYEVQIDGRGDRIDARLRRREAHRALERVLGVGDAWAFITQADKDRDAAARDAWAVEYNGPL